MRMQNKYWDAVAYQKRFAHPLLLGELKRHINPKSRILDCGCGYGRSIAELHKKGFTDLCGIDYSAGMLGRARKENPFARYARTTGGDIPFSDSSFDAVLLLAVLTCIPDSNEEIKLFSEIFRVLKAGGVLYLSDLLLNNDKRNRERYARFALRHGCYGVFELEEGVVLKHHTREHLERLAGPFKKLSQQVFRVETMNGHASRAIRMILQK